ncbi:uncharacterized protein LOC117321231 isoform X2 [Pecten maximus]|uniref:uncharacterized protein LOC117321231 isoform X2 n=1 Tax=Pecten maximus TaxID=6579 RepID=UPI0014590357|nr:uncharacterized protein LOC117321231 isoform X2 [Pecten maximus]
MAALTEKAATHKRDYEIALQCDLINAGIIEHFEEDPEKLLKAKRAILHCICLDKDPKTKDFRKQIRELVNAECDIPSHDDVFKFEEDQNNQDGTGMKSSCEIAKDVTDSIPHGWTGTETTPTAETDSQITPEAVTNTQTTPEAVTDTQTTPEAVTDTQTTPEAVTDTQTTPEAVRDTQTIPKPETDSQTTPKAETDTQTTPEAVTDTQTTPKAETDSQTTPKAETDTQTIPEAVTNTQTIPKPETDSQTKPKPETDSQTTPKAVTDKQSTPEAVTDTQTIPKAETDTQTTPVICQRALETENIDDSQYKIESEIDKRLALYIGIRHFDRRGDDGMSDGTGTYDDEMNREHEEKMDRKELERVLEHLNFTFKSNNLEKETTEKEVDALIDTVLTDAVNKKVGIIVVMISSHGEEALEQNENNKNKNILRHRILLEDKCLYIDDLLKKFETKKQLKGIPKLFFIQACRSRVTADREDRVDKGVELLVEASGTENGEITKLIKTLKTDRSLPDARPRNLNKLPKPAVQSGPPVKPEDTKPHMDESEVRNKKTDQIQTRPNVEQTIHEADARSRKPSDEITVEPIPKEEIPSISCIEDSLVMFASAPGSCFVTFLYFSINKVITIDIDYRKRIL